MGTKYSTNATSGYNSSPPADDGTVSEANKVKWSTIKTKLTDPLDTLASTINSELVTHFNNGPTAVTTNTTLAATHYNQIIQASGSGVTLTLTDASTLAAGWYCDIVSTDTTNSITLARATASDMINESSNNVTILPLQHLRVIVNAAANGFLVSTQGRHALTYKKAEQQTMVSKSLNLSQGANVASTADCNIWVGDGNTVHVTGTTAVSDWGTAPQAGASMWCINDSALTLTYNATTNILPGDNDIALPAGSWFEVYAHSTSSYEVRQILFSDGRSLGLVTGSATATTSGSTHDYTIPPWAKRVTISFSGVSTDGANATIIQLGDAGGIETTGYSGTLGRITNGSSPTTYAHSSYSGFAINANAAAGDTFSGQVVLTLLNASTFLWAVSGVLGKTDAAVVSTLGGHKATSALTTTVRLAIEGADAFDSGSINILYE